MGTKLEFGFFGWIVFALICALAVYGVVCMFTAGVMVGVFVLLADSMFYVGLTTAAEHRRNRQK